MDKLKVFIRLEQVGGKAEQLIAVLQKKYGYTREQAEQDFNRRLQGDPLGRRSDQATTYPSPGQCNTKGAKEDNGR